MLGVQVEVGSCFHKELADFDVCIYRISIVAVPSQAVSLVRTSCSVKWATLTAWWLLLLLQQSVSLRPLGCLLVSREYFRYSDESHLQSVTSLDDEANVDMAADVGC